ncbi:hypothetical protein [Actinopolymorpha rutila]|uniref:Zinc transporter ZupT n=1 Tax=Actinopolymorpha rutila TaxID=446787 RepID=A0A852ZKW9_9ACTN|nr:hypothetical protein [Actinopolymorpha rutila]NYH89840.1 zinc transporter ZupT [Actinopolymorpha rutila]
MEYVYFAFAGLLVGGMIASRQQKRSIWLTVVLGVLAGVFLWAGLRESTP